MFEIAVIGAGPGGLSAAARCAESGIDHVLLESSPKVANTIQKYQKGKHVMAEPGVLPLRSPIVFDAGKREEILDNWETGIDNLGVNIKYGAEVKSISGEKGNFTIGLISGDDIQAKHIILGIGMQGNPRQLGVPGDQAEWVQYQLDDPDEYKDESIAVVGAGDAAIENAIALSKNNKVYIINRKDEFARAKEGDQLQTRIREKKAGRAHREKAFIRVGDKKELIDPPYNAATQQTLVESSVFELNEPATGPLLTKF